MRKIHAQNLQCLISVDRWFELNSHKIKMTIPLGKKRVSKGSNKHFHNSIQFVYDATNLIIIKEKSMQDRAKVFN